MPAGVSVASCGTAAARRRTSAQSRRLASRRYFSRVQNTTATPTEPAPAEAAAPLTLNAPDLESDHTTMADSPSIVTSPYPSIVSGGNDDDSYRAALVSHASASVERNQDSHFNAAGQQRLLQDVAANRSETLQAKFDTERSDRATEREQARQFAEIKAELAAMRAESTAKELASLRAELSEAKASARADANEAVLARISTKLGL